MKYLILSLSICLFHFALSAQDSYHNNLQSELQSNYSLPTGTWVFNDTEVANLNSDYSYGAITSTNLTATGQDFSEKVNIVINAVGNNPWEAGYGIQNIAPINTADACLFVMWLRAIDSPGKVSLFVENSSTFDKEVFFTFELTEEWRQYLVPFDAEMAYAPGELTAGLQLSWQEQTIETAGIAMLNYTNTVNLDDLPANINNDQYGGYESDAPWRDEAANRIEQIRKANLSIRVEDETGMAIPNASVEVEMLQHDFAFGTAVVSSRFGGGNNQNETYESKILDLDGNGHGFNWVVFENSMKWNGWEQNWLGPKEQTAAATQWLVDHNIKVRGHTLCWPGWSNLPDDLETNAGDDNYFKNRMFAHIDEMTTYPGIAGNIEEWDVLNEITTNRDIEFSLQGQSNYPTGREIYIDIFEKLAAADPNIKTYINDYVTIGQANTGGGAYDLKKQFVQELMDAGVSLDGIGFQAHIGGFPTSIYDVKSILDDFHNTFGTSAKITEYDINDGVSDELAATYLRDFLSMTFSHESTDGFLMWGFWDGAHWKSNAPMFNQDWTIKPSGQTFVDMVFDEWWTTGNGETDSDGEYTIRGFKGTYQITIDCGNGEVLVDTVELLADQLFVKVDGALVADVAEQEALQFSVYPNPAKDFLTVQKAGTDAGVLQIFDLKGNLVFSAQMESDNLLVPLDFGNGLFEILFTAEGFSSIRQVLVLE